MDFSRAVRMGGAEKYFVLPAGDLEK